MKKILFIDVDGTIYKSHQSLIDESISEKIKEASKSIDLFLATGRCIPVLSILGDAVKYFKGFVLSNGTIVIENNNVIFKEIMDKTLLKKLINEAKRINANIALITKDNIYLTKRDEIVEMALQPYDTDAIIEVKDYNFDLSIDYNMAWSFDHNSILDVLEENTNGFTFFRWGEIGSDLVPIGITKAKGIEMLIKHLKQDDIITYAIGDSRNDIQMFKKVDVAICMGNGRLEAKQAATHITEDIYNHGFENAIDKIIGGIW